MARHRRRALLAVVAAVVPLVVAVMPVTAAAARIRIRCHDGDTSCDLDQTRDGKCTFLLPAGPFCCCSGGCRCACRFKSARVRARRRRVLKTAFGKYLFAMPTVAPPGQAPP